MSPEPLMSLLHLTGPGVFRDAAGQVWVVRSRRDAPGFDAYHVTWPPGTDYYMTLAPGALGDLREHMRVPSPEAAELGLAEFAHATGRDYGG